VTVRLEADLTLCKPLENLPPEVAAATVRKAARPRRTSSQCITQNKMSKAKKHRLWARIQDRQVQIYVGAYRQVCASGWGGFGTPSPSPAAEIVGARWAGTRWGSW